MTNLSNNGLSSIFIDGKPVKKASLGGKVFFEKHNYDLSVTSDKTILSYYDNDSCTITARLTDYDVPIPGETVLFYDENGDIGTYSPILTDIDKSLGDSWSIYCVGSISSLYFGNISDGVIYSKIGSNVWRLRVLVNDEEVIRNDNCGPFLSYSNGIFSSNGQTIDISSYSITPTILNTVMVTSSKNSIYYKAIGVGVTDSNGECSVVYDSKGAGDLNIKCECMNLQETYSIEDCIDYDALTSNNNKFTLTGSANVSYSSNGLSMVGTTNATSLYLYKGTLPSNYIVECDVISYTFGAYNWGSEICVSHTIVSNGINNGNKTRFGTFTDANYGNTGFTYTDVSRIDVPYHLKVEIDNGTATFYIDDVQIHQRSSGTTDFGLKSYNNRGVVIKNMKIKPL